MHTSAKYGKPMIIIYPGELYVSKEDICIATLLGSCISVCFYDSKNMVSGMNHFMLPGRITSVDSKCAPSSKYGITAIKELLAAMYQNGADRKYISAKIFGGGNVIELSRPQGPVSEGNIRMARVMVELEDIPICHEDIGGKFTRKLIMEVKSGKVFVKRTTKDDKFEDQGTENEKNQSSCC